MYSSNSEYDRGINTFSPEGRLFQVEYATESIKLGTTAIGLWTKKGVVLAVEKRILSPLIVSNNINKIFEIDSHVGVAVSGLIADGQLIVDNSRKEAQRHMFKYNERIKPNFLTQKICDLALRFGESGSEDSGDRKVMSRPFGVSMLVGGMDKEIPVLFYTDPTGTSLHHDYKAIGASSEVAEAILSRDYKKDMKLEEAIIIAMRVLKEVMEDPVSSSNTQLAIATKKDLFKIFSEKELEDVLAKL